MLNLFSCVCWSSVFPLWKKVYSVLLPFFNHVVHFFELFIYVGYLSLISHIICKHFFPLSRFYFCFVDHFLCCAKAVKFN